MRRLLLAATLTICATNTIAAPADEFFIISSVDVSQSRLVVKRPTEVTAVVRVTSQTTITAEQHEKLALRDLRAGDTIYAVVVNGTATQIRRGPMTVEELRRRYLPGLWPSVN